MIANDLRERGFAVAKGYAATDGLDRMAEVLRTLIREEAERAGPDTCARVADLDDRDVLHAGLLLLRDAHPDHMARTVDRAKVAPAFLRALYSDALQDLAATILDVPSSWVGLSHPNLRADLPDRYVREQTAFSLPWHQEAAYFEKSVSRNGSLVFWIALDDCRPEDGCLEVLEGSHRAGLVAHTLSYRDPVNRRHLRYETAAEVCVGYPQRHCATERGDVGVIDFRTIHRSGRNRGDRIRYTLLIRASNLFAEDYHA